MTSRKVWIHISIICLENEGLITFVFLFIIFT